MNQPKKPTSKEAVAALALAILALALAVLGVYSPWGALRYPVALKLHGTNAVLAYGGTCVLPILMGLGAAALGGHAYRGIDLSEGKVAGDGQAFFSLMIGLFAVTVGASTTFAALVWPYL
jgi:hypothetical protein